MITRPVARYKVLDGLRGIAAIGVLLWHLSIIGLPHIAPHGYLAVDFFFLLSGFVISHSYQERLSSMLFHDFLKLRIIRIFPLCTLGILVGSVYFIIRYFARRDSQYSINDILFGTLFNLFLLPKPWISGAPTDTIFPSNTPLWSLSLEMLVNLFWAFAAYKVRSRVLLGVVCGAGAVVVYSVMQHHTADLGSTWPTYVGGLSRAVFGFYAGALIWRFRPLPGSNHRISWISLMLLVFSLLAPEMGGGLYDLVAIFGLFPLALYCAACADLRVEQRLLVIIGDLSYPLYVIHFPILLFFVGFARTFHFDHLMPPLVTVPITMVCILAAVILSRYYDRPIRRFITRGK